MLPKKTSLAIVTFGILLLLLQAARFARSTSAEAVLDFPVHTPAPPPREAPTPSRRVTHPEPPRVPAGPNLIDGGHLTVFYQALWRTESHRPGAVTRVLHYGDSPVTADSITADVRSLLQERFGDAGHGFVLIAKPWAWYGHRGVDVNGKGWKIEPASQAPAHDGFHGLGGVSFQGGAGASSHFLLKEDHSRMEIEYLRQPGGGALSVRAAGQWLGEIETAGDAKQAGFQTFPLPAGARSIDLNVDRGPVRLFGVTFERDGPGVIYNSLGLNGAQVHALVRFFEKNQWTVQLQHQNPDLVIINYGTNESIYADYIDRYYAGELREVIRRVQAALPNASVLIMSPMDRAEKNQDGEMATPPTLLRLVDIQRRVAAEMGCAFFNTFQAMGGAGTMVRWYNSQPRLVSADYMHPFPAGARKVGVLLYEALMDGFEEYKAASRRASQHAKSTEGQP